MLFSVGLAGPIRPPCTFLHSKGSMMAELLYRLGRVSARHAWRVIGGWASALVLAGVAYLAFGGTLAFSFTIPNTPTAQVNELLEQEMGETNGATGTVVFTAEDGSALTAEQRAAISARLAEVAAVDGVATVVDPFATQSEREATAAQLAEGRAQIEAGREQLEAGQAELEAARLEADAAQTQLDAGLAELEAGQAQLVLAREQLDEAAALYGEAAVAEQRAQLDAQQGLLDAGLAELEAGQAQLDAGRTQLEAGAAEIEAGLAQLEPQEAQLELAERLLGYAAEIRTVSLDGSTAQAMVLFNEDMFDLAPEVRDEVAALLDVPVRGVTVDYSAEFTATLDGLLGVGEVLGVLVAALVLLAMLGSALPAAVPLVSAVTGVGVAITASLALSGVVEMTSVTPVLGVMLGLAVGIDYSLFILHRHRRQLLHGIELHESIGLANGTSGNAVAFAGSTVFIALLALAVTGMPFLAVMGAVGAFSVLVAVAVAVTLTPALLGLLGDRVLPRRARARIGAPENGPVVPRPMRTSTALLTSAVAIVGLLVVAVPTASMRLGLPDGSSEPRDSTQYRTFTTVAEQFGAGQSGPLLVAASLPGAVAEEAVVATQAEVAGALMAVPDVVAVAPVGVSPDRDLLTFQVIPAEGPNSESTADLVHALRDLSLADGTELGVAGQASANIDVSDALAGALPLYLIVVVGLSLVIMTVVFRSLLVPLVATAGFVLSLLAALGAVVAVYQWGWLGPVFGVHSPGPVLSFLPIILTGVLFGLAMDYQLFLVSGMREAYVHGALARTAVVSGLHAARAVVTAAAIIMASVFGGFMFSHLTMVRPLGFGLAVGVLFDAFVVRMVLVPALMHLFGEKAWWLPRWLDRLLPQADVEGARLERRHPVARVAEPARAVTEPAADPTPADSTPADPTTP